MKYEILKELMDAGFTQVGEGTYVEGNIESDETGIITTNSVYEPTLEELIEACGEDFESLVRDYKTGGWKTNTDLGYSEEPGDSQGSTPKEAVARLYIVLNRK